MTALTTQQAEATVLADFFDRTEQLRQIAVDARLKCGDALAALHGDPSDEARLLSLVIMNSGGVFLEAMEEAFAAGSRLVTLWDEAVECSTLSDEEISEEFLSSLEPVDDCGCDDLPD